MKNTAIIIVAILVLATLGLVFAFRGSGSKNVTGDQNQPQSQGQGVKLMASADKASYAAGEPVTLNITLTNSGPAAVCLSEGALGNIRFASFTRDGAAVETREAPSEFLTSFTAILKSRLVPLGPGEKIEFGLASSFDPGLDTEALSTTRPDNTSGIATFYGLAEPGEYKIELVYEYTAGPTDDCRDIFSGQTNGATVIFKVE